jgi:hypothetical protein
MECVVCGNNVVKDLPMKRVLNALTKKMPRFGGRLLAWYIDYKNSKMLSRYRKKYATVIKMAVSGRKLIPRAGVHPIGELTPGFWSSLNPIPIIPPATTPSPSEELSSEWLDEIIHELELPKPKSKKKILPRKPKRK